jgi:hypothetical protein
MAVIGIDIGTHGAVAVLEETGASSSQLTNIGGALAALGRAAWVAVTRLRTCALRPEESKSRACEDLSSDTLGPGCPPEDILSVLRQGTF